MKSRRIQPNLNRWRNSPHGPFRRRGVVPLEFGLSLPILLVIMVTVIWFGAAMFRQADVTVKARNKAWRQRSDHGSDRPFEFAKPNLISASEEKRVGVSPLFNGFAPASSRHYVMGGSWDHRQMRQYRFGERHPNWRVVGVIGRGQIRGALDLIRNIWSNVRFDGAAFQQLFGGLLSQLTGFGNKAQSGLAKERKKVNDRADAQIKRVKQNVKENEAKLKQVNAEIQSLEADKKKLQKELDEDKKKKKTDKTKLKPKQRKLKEARLRAVNKQLRDKRAEKRKIEAELQAGRRYLRETQ